MDYYSTVPSSCDEEVQFYEQPSFHNHGHPKSSFATSCVTGVSDHHVSPSPSSCSNITSSSTGQMTSSSSTTTTTTTTTNSSKCCVLKSIRRRCRASKKTPTTLLNANPTNFRALVQQFTGCPRTSISFGSVKGPVTLNFRLGSIQKHSKIAPSVNNDHYHHQESRLRKEQLVLDQAMKQQQQQHNQLQPQHSMVSSDEFISSTSDHVYPPVVSGDLEMPVGFVMDDIPLHELTMESCFSSAATSGMDDYFF